MEALFCALHHSYGLSTHIKDIPSAFSERVAGVASGHGYRVYDVAETFWSDFSQKTAGDNMLW